MKNKALIFWEKNCLYKIIFLKDKHLIDLDKVYIKRLVISSQY